MVNLMSDSPFFASMLISHSVIIRIAENVGFLTIEWL